jgi:predicted deacylase
MLKSVDYGEYLLRLRSAGSKLELSEYGSVRENGRAYPLLRVVVPGARTLIITAGFHGEEPAGPLTLAAHLSEIAQYARSRGVGLRVYPCINPSGFESGSRYNASDERPNNDFLRYEVEPGVFKGELNDGEAFLRHELHRGGPKETRALVEELSGLPPPVAALDIHQDRYLAGAWTYAYVFGDREPYRPLMRAASAHAKVAGLHLVDELRRTDHDGLIAFHDGSVTDFFHRQGARYTATLETTTQTPMERCHLINLLWIRGFIDLAAS